MKSFGLPNYITLLRFILIPFISLSFLKGRYDLSLLFLLCAAISDLLDGALARILGQRSKLGAILDPAADKTLMFVLILTFGWARQISWIVVLLIVLRDLYIVLGTLFLKIKCKRIYIRPTYLSKATTFFQVSLLALSLARAFVTSKSNSFHSLGISWMQDFFILANVLAVLFTLASGLHYTLIGLAIYRNREQ